MVSRTRWLVASVLFVLTAATALADKQAPDTSYKQEVPGGPFVFVMIAPSPLEEEVATMPPALAAEVREIRRVYPRSGLYPDDGTAKPLWTVNWYAHNVELASDGIHMVRLDQSVPIGAGAGGAHAISFYANGVLLRTYTVGELVASPSGVPHSVTQVLWFDRGQLDGARLEYTLTTAEGRRYIFDLRTGAVVADSQAVPVDSIAIGFAVVGGAGLFAVVFVAGGWLLARGLRRKGG